MNKKASKKVFAILIIFTLTFSLVACGKKKATIVGTWVETNSKEKDEYIFNEDRTGVWTMSSLSAKTFTYTIEGETISIVMPFLSEEIVKSYNYKLDSDNLTMTIDGQDVTFQR